MQDAADIFLPDSNQISLAADLGILLEEGASADSVVLKIDQALSKKSVEERARWFVLSVFRHLTAAQWPEPGASKLDMPRQYSLAQDCLRVDGFKKSMTTVLKDRRYAFTLLSFGKTKNVKKNLMSSGTKAYKIAAAVLEEAGLLQKPERIDNGELVEDIKEEPATLSSATEAYESVAAVAEEDGLPEMPAEDSGETSAARTLDNTAANRRAGRRGYLAAELHSARAAHSTEEPAAKKNQVSSMSEKEFLDLEAAIENSPQKPTQQEWSYRSNEDRWSLILGLAAGVGFFSLVLILFL